jgi:pyridoxamine 5'-phosphate oxidase
MEDIHKLRKDYIKGNLDKTNMDVSPLKQFEIWFNEALNAKIDEPNAMVLSTLDLENQPQARIVLLKELSEEGFTFFTNYDSNKGIELKNEPKASLLFFWKELERQVRIIGSVHKINREKSEQYFHSRPVGSQIGAHVSPQSKVIESRNFLEEKTKYLEEKYKNSTVPLPENWGGFNLKPSKFEFWQGRSNRLHDRILYTLSNENWVIERLAP